MLILGLRNFRPNSGQMRNQINYSNHLTNLLAKRIMTKIKITAILIATLISGATHSLSAQSEVQPTPIETGSILGELESQISGSGARSQLAADPILEPVESGRGSAEDFVEYLAQHPNGDDSGEVYFDQGFSGGGVGGGVGGLLGSFFASPSGTNRVWGISGVGLSRERFNDGVQFPGGIDSEDTTHSLGGIDVTMTTRNGQGRGWEFRYLGLFENTTTVEADLPAIGILPIAPQTLTRTSELHNFELNLLQQRRNRILWVNFDVHESLLGIRYYRFDEALDFRDGTVTIPPSQTRTEVENSLFGIQTGRRVEKRLVGRLGFYASGKLGVFNNRAKNSNFQTTPLSAVIARETKNDVAFVGELDLGGIFTINNNLRMKGGYRALASTGVGLADGQFNQDGTIRTTVNTTGDLFLRGGYFGFELVY